MKATGLALSVVAIFKDDPSTILDRELRELIEEVCEDYDADQWDRMQERGTDEAFVERVCNAMSHLL